MTEFLCIKCEDQLIGEIGTKCQIENMKREKIQNNEDWRDNTAGMYREGTLIEKKLEEIKNNRLASGCIELGGI